MQLWPDLIFLPCDEFIACLVMIRLKERKDFELQQRMATKSN